MHKTNPKYLITSWIRLLNSCLPCKLLKPEQIKLEHVFSLKINLIFFQSSAATDLQLQVTEINRVGTPHYFWRIRILIKKRNNPQIVDYIFLSLFKVKKSVKKKQYNTFFGYVCQHFNFK